jgi:hypothetical protein
MHRALGSVVLASFVLVSCRIGFDPVDGDEVVDEEEHEETGAAGSTLITAQPGSDFYTACSAGQPCAVDCTAAMSCIVACNGASSCDVACTASECIVEQCTPPACRVDCGAGQLYSFGATTFCD